MSRIGRLVLAMAVAIASMLATAGPAKAALIQLNSFAELMNPVVATYPQPQFTVLPSPHVLVAGGVTLTFTESGSFIRLNQGSGWTGEFPPGTALLYTGNDSGTGTGPITLEFSMPIFAFGVLSQIAIEGPGMFNFMAFNGPTLLGGFNVAAGNFASFLGARATDGDVITRIIFSASSPITGGTNNFAIGPVSFEPIPEPATLALLGAGLVVGCAAGRARRRREQRSLG